MIGEIFRDLFEYFNKHRCAVVELWCIAGRSKRSGYDCGLALSTVSFESRSSFFYLVNTDKDKTIRLKFIIYTEC
jgi:hypothetical protein